MSGARAHGGGLAEASARPGAAGAGARLPPGLLISAPRSGSGKTVVMLGLLRALTEDGLVVQPYKSGPDYIDPAFHQAAAGRASYNLDSWAMAPGLIAAGLARGAGADLALAEGSMGLHDGVALPGEAGTGASADIALRAGWPVVLVIDVSGQAQTAAAVAWGLARFRPGLPVAGVILNRVASPRHAALVGAGMAAVGIPVLGALPRAEGLALPERHLGLVQAGEHGDLERFLAGAARLMRDHVDLAALRAAAGRGANVPDPAPALPPEPAGGRGPAPEAKAAPGLAPPGQVIALAQDAAFSFIYPHLLAAWREAGAEIRPFSPLADEPPPEADTCWLPGGYPELHAGRLAAAGRFRAGLVRFARTRPVHGECGGYMALGQGLVDAAGRRHQMAGLLGLVTSFARRKMHLGYRQAELLAPMAGQGAGARLRGHEFHYATVLEQTDPPLARVTDANGAPVAETGSHRGRVGGSFFHLIGPVTGAAT